jgi:aspartyl/asparaginyl beta-hydroxylase (cupin superfamily)
MNSFLIVILIYYAVSICIAIQLPSFNLIHFYITLLIVILAYYITYILLNPTEILYPYNLLIENLYEKKVFYSDIEKQEVFPTSKILEKNWKKIREEFTQLNVLNNNIGNIGQRFINQDKDFWKGWTTFELRSFDKDNEENMKSCPILANILKSDPNISTAFFSILEPGKTIPSHYGPFKGILRYHLSLKIPPKESGDCFISVDEETYDWQEGEGVLFDESYKHFVKNDTPYYRVILFLDVRRPVYFQMLNNFLLYLMSISPYNH